MVQKSSGFLFLSYFYLIYQKIKIDPQNDFAFWGIFEYFLFILSPNKYFHQNSFVLIDILNYGNDRLFTKSETALI